MSRSIEGFVASGEIQLRGLDDKQGRRGVVKEEVLVGLVEFSQVLRIGVDRLPLEVALAVAKTPDQHIGRCLQVDHEIG